MAASKLSYKEFEENMRKIRERTTVDNNEPEPDKRKRIDSLLNDYGAFFEYYLPHYASSKCGWFHIWAANMLLHHLFIRLALMWFRGAAKSVHSDIGYPLFLKAHGELKNMVLVGQNENKAQKLLSDIQAELMANQRYSNDFGKQYSHGNWEDGNFKTKDGCGFFALGIGQSPRGLREAANRPDFIIVDDVDTREMSLNPKRVREAADWVTDDLMGCFDGPRQRFIIANNGPFTNQVIRRIADEKTTGGTELSVKLLYKFVTAIGAFYYRYKNAWHFLKVDAIDAEGEPSWPEKYDKAYWEMIQEDESFRTFQRERQNTPVIEGGVFKQEWIKWKPALPLDEYDGLIVYIDPSWKATAGSDYKAVVFLGKKGKEIHRIKSFVRHCTIGTMVKYTYDLFESIDFHRKDRPYLFEMNGPVNCDFWIEANANQDLHLEDFEEEGELRGYQLPIRGDLRVKPEKFGRIESLSPFYERGFMFHNEAGKDDPDMLRAIEFKLAFEQGSKTPDDDLDAEEGGIWHLQRTTRINSFVPISGKRIHKESY